MKKSKNQTSIQEPRSASQGSGRAASFFSFPPLSLKEAKSHPLLPLPSSLLTVSLLQVDYMDFEVVTEETKKSSRKRSFALILTEPTRFEGFPSQP